MTDRITALQDGSWRQGVVTDALTWMWTPYQHKGRVKGVGADCGGLLYEVYNPWLGPFQAFPSEYPADWAMHAEGEMDLDFIKPYVEEVSIPQIGGFTLFHFGLNYSHAAIYLGNGQYIHAQGTNRNGSVKRNGALFFQKMSGGHPPKHFDVSSSWLCSLYP